MTDDLVSSVSLLFAGDAHESRADFHLLTQRPGWPATGAGVVAFATDFARDADSFTARVCRG